MQNGKETVPNAGFPGGVLTISNPAWVKDYRFSSAGCATDEERMRLAVALSRENVLRGTGGPFGSAVFEEESGRLVSVGVNSVERLRNSTLHAEVIALMLAQASTGSFSLREAGGKAFVLYASCEPCAMCLGAALWSGVRRIVCGARREAAAAIGFDEGPVFAASYQYLEDRGISIVRGVLAEEAEAVLKLYQERGGIIYNA